MPSSKFSNNLKIAAAFLPIIVFYLVWGWSNELGNFGGDNAIYLFTAEYLSPFSAPSDLVSEYAKSSPYPPLYPIVLAIFGGGHSLLAAHLITITCLLIATFVLFQWQRVIGISPIPAYLVCCSFVLLPGTYFQALEILSENLYLALSLLALWATSRAEKFADHKWLTAAACFVAAATLTRTAGVTLVAAFILYLIIHRPVTRGRLAAMAIIAAFPATVFQLLKKTGDVYIPAFISAYSAGSLSALVGQWSLQINTLAYGWIALFVQYWSVPVAVALSVIGIICLAGLVYRLRLGRLDALYGAFYLILIIVWPFPAEAARFMFVFLPILIVQGVWLLKLLPPLRGRSMNVWPEVLIAVLSIIILPQWISNMQRFLDPLPSGVAAFKRTPEWYARNYDHALHDIYYTAHMSRAFKEIPQKVPEGECVYSIKPSVVAFLSRRYSKAPPVPATAPEEFYQKIVDGQCKYFLLLQGGSPTYNASFYPLERIQGKIRIVEIFAIEQLDQTPVVAILAKLKDS